ncbi:MAG TPA: GNAT family N-acetyltransferase [Candidatus Limnocylindrales bacterium]
MRDRLHMQVPPGGAAPSTIDAMIEEAAVTLRPAAPSDAQRIAALFTDEGYPAGASDILTRLERFASPASTVVVADLDGEVLGFVAVHLIPRFEHGDSIARIVALVVDPDVRARGIGHLLMAEAERIGREAGAAFAEITAGHHRPEARHLYESLGYDASVAAYLRKRLSS